MLKISEAVKNSYSKDSCSKELKISFPSLGLTFTNENIDGENFKLSESILEGASLECIGCISSCMTINIYGLNADVKNQFIQVSVIDDETQTELPLFNGFVESSKKEGYKGMRSLEAYDALYKLNNIDVTEWYNNHSVTTVQNLLKELLDMCNIAISPLIEIPNGMVTAFCGTKKPISQLSALQLLKHICQINGGFGRINRYNNFDMIYLNEPLGKKRFPSVQLFPMYEGALYPNMPGTLIPPPTIDLTFPYYRSVKFEEFNVKPISKIIIRDFEGAEGVFYGSGENKYIIQGNIFAFEQTSDTLKNICKNIYYKIQGISYTPFESANYSLPFVECGDNVFYLDLEGETEIKRSFFIFKREISGIQAMTDNYFAEGVENQNVFITDLGSQIQSLRDEQSSSEQQKANELEELKKRVARLEALIGSMRTVTGLVIDKPVAESINTEILLNTVTEVDDNE